MSAGNVVALRPKDRVKQDVEPIATIYRSLGAASAEQVVSRALTELAMTMAGLAHQVKSHDLGDMERQLRRLQRMSENLGMVSLGLIAGEIVAVERRCEEGLRCSGHYASLPVFTTFT